MAAARQWPWWLVFVASFAFRWPALTHPEAMNSDVAIVGLQAMHMLRGEWSPFLYGSGYQTSTDAVAAALMFAVAGATPLALMLSALVGHVVLTWIVYALLARHLGRVHGALLASALVLTTCVVHIYALGPPRQWALTLALFAVWLVTADHRIRADARRLAAGGFVGALAVFADPYALVFLLPLAILAGSVAFASRAGAARRALAYVAGSAAGLAPVVLLWTSRDGAPREVIPSLEMVSARWRLLRATCGPIALGLHYPGEPAHGRALDALHVAAVVALAIAVVVACAAPWIRRVPAPVARLAVFGVSTTAVTLVGFVLSRCAVDVYSCRYLVAPSLVVPLVLAPAAYVAPRRAWAALLAAPIVISCGLAGWGALADAVARQAPSVEQNEAALERALAERGVTRAVASYWIAYRLTFLYDERVVVVPREAVLDRYRPYRERVFGGDKIAYIVERWVPRDAEALRDERVRKIGVPYERFDSGRYTVLLLSRRSAGAVAGAGFARVGQ